jgi:hypothetical protein
VVHYWVLRQQAPFPSDRVSLPSSVDEVGVPGWWGWGVVSGFPASCRWSWSLLGGRRPPVCGVCGLLFENCIVDASILRTGAAADPGGSSFAGGAAWWVVVPCS